MQEITILRRLIRRRLRRKHILFICITFLAIYFLILANVTTKLSIISETQIREFIRNDQDDKIIDTENLSRFEKFSKIKEGLFI